MSPSSPALLRTHQAVGLFVLLLAVFYSVGALWIESQSGYAGISTRTVPLVIAAGLALCGLKLLLKRDSVLPQAPDTDGVKSQFGRLGWLLAGLLLNIALIGFIGLPLASTVLMVCVARGYGSLRPVRDALIALTLTIALWLLFTRVLSIGLPLLPLLGI